MCDTRPRREQGEDTNGGDGQSGATEDEDDRKGLDRPDLWVDGEQQVHAYQANAGNSEEDPPDHQPPALIGACFETQQLPRSILGDLHSGPSESPLGLETSSHLELLRRSSSA